MQLQYTLLVAVLCCLTEVRFGRASSHHHPLKGKYPNPGFRTAITNKGLGYVLQVGLPILQSELSSIKIPDISGNTHVAIGKIDYNLKNIHLNDLTFGKPSLVSKPEDGLFLSVSGISLHASADWHYKAHILFPISDSGSVDLSASDVSLSVGVVIGANDKGHATLSTKECSFDVSHITVHFHGGASWLYNLFDSQISDAIKKGLNGQICKVASKAINDQGSKALESLPVLVSLDKVAAIDYALVKPPNFTDWYIETDHKGEFFPVSDTSKEAPFFPSPLPPLTSLTNNTSSRMMYLWLTDYLVNTAALVYQEAGMLQYNITPEMIPKDSPVTLDTTFISKFLSAPGLAGKYPHMKMKILLNVTQPPFVNITPSGANISVPAEAVFYVQTKNATVFVFTIGASVEMPVLNYHVMLQGVGKKQAAMLDVKAKLVENSGKEVIRANATFLEASFRVLYSDVGKIDISTFQELFNSLANNILIKQVNKYFNKGLPLPTVDGISFVDATITLGKGYIMVTTDVSYKPSYF